MKYVLLRAALSLKGRKLLEKLGLCQLPSIYYIGSSQSLPPPLTPEEEKEYLAHYTGKEPEIRQALIEHNLRLVVYIARKFENTGIGIEDLISIGTIGLIKGVNTYRGDKNTKLATYASRCIENEILMHFRAQKRLQGEVSLSDSVETGGDGSLSLMDVIAVDDDMLENLDAREACQKVRRCVQTCLNPRERTIITLRYGLGGQTPCTQREVAARCGISRSYVSRIEKRALGKLEQAMDGWRPG